MGTVKPSSKVKIIVSIFTNNTDTLEKSIKIIESDFGELELVTPPFIFNHTKYYEKEMGGDLFRKFVVLKELLPRDNIALLKLKSNQIESYFLKENRRTVNIDPGYLSLENFILLTTKNYTHRVYLEKGIYADITLIFHKNQFEILPWTYPDYASEEIRNFLIEIRKIYKNQLSEE